MSTFTIDSANNIAAFASQDEATAVKINSAEYFASARELNKLAGSWPANRVIDVWNSFAGVSPFGNLKPVKKFTDRKAAVARIWEAIQRLVPNVAQPAPDVTPAKGKRDKDTKKGKRADLDLHAVTSRVMELPAAISCAFSCGLRSLGYGGRSASLLLLDLCATV